MLVVVFRVQVGQDLGRGSSDDVGKLRSGAKVLGYTDSLLPSPIYLVILFA